MDQANTSPMIRVLAIDDEEIIGRCLRRLNLDDPNCQFETTTDPAAGLTVLMEGRADVLLVDVMMPVLDGYEVMRRARAIDRHLPIIALTANAGQPEVEIRCLQSGASYFMAKPFQNEVLLTVIRQFFAHSRQQRERDDVLTQLKHSQDFLQAVIDNSPDCIFVKNLNGEYLLANQALCQRIGEPAEEIVGRTNRELPLALPVELAAERDREAVASNAPVRYEFQLNEEPKTCFSVCKFPLLDLDGQPWAICGIARDVTVQKRAEAELEHAYNELRQIFNASSDGLAVIDRNLKIVKVNDRLSQMWGIPPEELVGQSCQALLAAPNCHATGCSMLGDRDTPNPSNREWEVEHPDASGQPRYYSVTASAMWDPQGRTVGIIENFRDVTERKRLNEELRMLGILTQANPNLVLRCSRDGAIQYANPCARDWLHRHHFTKIEELRRLLPENLAVLMKLAASEGQTLTVETSLGHEFFDCKLAYFSTLETGIVTLTDVSTLKRVSQERELYFQAFQESVHGVAITDAAGNITHINKAFERLYGYTQAEAVGQNPRILNPGRAVYRDLGIDERAYDRLFSTLWEELKDPHLGMWEGDLANRCKDGTIRWVHLFISAIHDADRRVIGYVGMPMDITLRREKERSIRLEVYQALTELAETRDQETGEHLKRISSYSRLLAERLDLPRHFIEDLEVFAPLHDIGKVGIPDQILLAPRRLTAEEFEIMKGHASLGCQILRGRPTLEMAAEIANGHHERYDGGGYPQGLAGEAIPLAARIVALADVYDALRSRRPYKEPWTHEAAAQVIRDGRATHFDPRLVDIFFARETEFAEIAVRLADK